MRARVRVPRPGALYDEVAAERDHPLSHRTQAEVAGELAVRIEADPIVGELQGERSIGFCCSRVGGTLTDL